MVYTLSAQCDCQHLYVTNINIFKHSENAFTFHKHSVNHSNHSVCKTLRGGGGSTTDAGVQPRKACHIHYSTQVGKQVKKSKLKIGPT